MTGVFSLGAGASESSQHTDSTHGWSSVTFLLVKEGARSAVRKAWPLIVRLAEWRAVSMSLRCCGF